MAVEFFAEALQDAGFGLINSVEGHAEVGRDVARGVVFHRQPPERLPGVRFKIIANDLRGPAHEDCPAAIATFGPRRRFAFGNLLQPVVHLAAADWVRDSVANVSAEVVANLVAGDDPQPTAETAAGR